MVTRPISLSSPHLHACLLQVVLPPGGGAPVDWHSLAGADEVRVQVEESLVLPLRHPHALESITRGTRAESASRMAARPAALLFHGPPGTGKTSAARACLQRLDPNPSGPAALSCP